MRPTGRCPCQGATWSCVRLTGTRSGCTGTACASGPGSGQPSRRAPRELRLPVPLQLCVVADEAVAGLHVAVEGELLVGRAAEGVVRRCPALAQAQLVAAE